MIARTDVIGSQPQTSDVAEARYEQWKHWPVNWTAVWVGALASLAVALVIGLIGLAIGANLLGPEHRVVDLHKMSIGALIFGVCTAFFAFAAGGWIAGKIAGILRAEPGMLHGAIVWLVALPIFLVLIPLGAGSMLGGWYAGLSGTPAWGSSAATPFERPDAIGTDATPEQRIKHDREMAKYRQDMQQWKEETPQATRNSALGAVTALLLGLVGSVIGGWMASGEPMNFTHHRTRTMARTAV